MIHSLTSVRVTRYPVLAVTFEDGLSGELDLGADIEGKPMFAELKDKAFFNRVALGLGGHSLGWKLDRIGEEIDFSADGIRTHVETELVRKAAAEYRAKMQAAE